MQPDSSLFRKYDIRGHADHNLSDAVVYQIGQGIATFMRRQFDANEVIIGHDNRISSPRLHTQLVAGVRAGGCDVSSIGVCSTPTLYWYAARQRSGGVMITGSHLAAPFNGFKLCYGLNPLHGNAMSAIHDLIAAEDFSIGEGTYTELEEALAPYIADVAQRVQPQRRLKIAVDGGNGTAGLYAAALFERWGMTMTGLALDLDGNFPNHPPDPSKAANISALTTAVANGDYDLGLAFDGDADRVVAVAENGAIIQPDRLLALLAQDVLKRHPGATVIGDVTCSQALFDAVEAAGGQPVMWMTGHSLIKEKMRETGALIAGEISGHMFFAEDYYGFDDAYLAAGKLIALLAESDQSLSALDAALPQYVSSPVYRPHCDPPLFSAVIEACITAWRDEAELVTLDGVRARFAEGWTVIRASNTEPVLSIRLEGRTRAAANAVRERVIAVLQAFDGVGLDGLREEL